MSEPNQCSALRTSYQLSAKLQQRRSTDTTPMPQKHCADPTQYDQQEENPTAAFVEFCPSLFLPPVHDSTTIYWKGEGVVFPPFLAGLASALAASLPLFVGAMKSLSLTSCTHTLAVSSPPASPHTVRFSSCHTRTSTSRIRRRDETHQFFYYSWKR